MKKVLLSFISLALVGVLFVNPSEVKATNFEGQEDKYIKICSSSTLAKSKEKVCKEFNKYLKNKNSELKDEIKESQSDLEETKDDILAIQSKISSINSQIATKEKEINYLLSSIDKIEKYIEKKNEQMKDRLYVMQSDYNSNTFVQFILGAESFSDIFSRINSLNDITAYENDLIAELTEQKKELDSQKKTLLEAKANLQSHKDSAKTLQSQLTALKKKQEQEITANKSEIKENEAAQKEINETLAEIAASVPKDDIGGEVIKGDSETGNKIASIAIGRIGCPYYWGATGPNYFDCSGLVYYCLKNAGISGGRGTANSYAYSGKAVSYNQLQAGDVVCFKRSGSSTYHHIGIYIGGGIVVHASGEGSTCLGNHASLGHVVKRTPLSSFSSYSKVYRRLY